MPPSSHRAVSTLPASGSTPPGIGELRQPGDLRRYIGAVRQGLLFLDAAGRVVTCTPPAEQILRDYDPGFSGLFSLKSLMRLLRTTGALNSTEAVRKLRAAPGEDRSLCFDVAYAERTVQVEVHPVLGGGWVVTLEDVSSRRRSEVAAAEMARLDPLTRLPNRLMLRERLDEALSRHARSGERCAVMLIDLDRFKPVNDTLGHAMGDVLLERVADRLRTTVRPTDTVARIGGDEFVVLQTGLSDAVDAETLARRVVDLIGRTYVAEGQLLNIGASIGVALVPSDGTSAERLLKCADLALYRAKVEGRGTFRFFEPAMDARMQSRRQIEMDMRQALARREFQLHYQPQLNLQNNQLVGCEALIRWQHPQRGQIAPADFIPLAEELGLIVPMGEWVIRQACRDAMTWPLPLTVAVNVSPVQFKSDRLTEIIVSALASAGLPPRRLEVEITEGVLLSDSQRTLATLHQLRELGVRVSMDDFGTGYSSLSYLRSFPFDKIKIDRSFVRDMAHDPEGDAIIRAISGLGRSLGITTVAEGVETAEQMERIRAEGCTDVQGYLISKPLPSPELMRLFQTFSSRPDGPQLSLDGLYE